MVFLPLNKWNHHLKTAFCIYWGSNCLTLKLAINVKQVTVTSTIKKEIRKRANTWLFSLSSGHKNMMVIFLQHGWYLSHNCEDFANTYFPHLSSLRGGSKAWMNAIKLPNSHHARVNLVVQLQSEYGDQHDAYSGLNIEMRTYWESNISHTRREGCLKISKRWWVTLPH